MFTSLCFKGFRLCFFIIFDEKKAKLLTHIWPTEHTRAAQCASWPREPTVKLQKSSCGRTAVWLFSFISKKKKKEEKKEKRKKKNPTAPQWQHSRVNAHKLVHLTRRTFFWPGSVMSFNTPPRVPATTHALGPEWTCDLPTRQRCADCDWLCFLEV